MKESKHKDRILYDSVYLKFLEKVKLQRQKTDQWYTWVRECKCGLTKNGHDGADRIVLKLDCSDAKEK